MRVLRNCGQVDASCVWTFDALHPGLCNNEEDLPIWLWFSSTSQVTMMPAVQLYCDGGWIPTMLIAPLCVAMVYCPGSSSLRFSAGLRVGDRAATAPVLKAQSSVDLSAWQARCVFKTIEQVLCCFPDSTFGIVIFFLSAAFADRSIHSLHELHDAPNGILHPWGQLGLFDFWNFFVAGARWSPWVSPRRKGPLAKPSTHPTEAPPLHSTSSA